MDREDQLTRNHNFTAQRQKDQEQAELEEFSVDQMKGKMSISAITISV